MKKSKKIFLCVGFSVVAATLLAFAVWAVRYVGYVQDFWAARALEGPYSGVDTLGWPSVGDIPFAMLLCLFPILLTELSLLRNGRLFWAENPSNCRICLCALSSLLALYVPVMMLLASTVSGPTGTLAGTVGSAAHFFCLYWSWPTLLVSFLLGGICRRRK